MRVITFASAPNYKDQAARIERLCWSWDIPYTPYGPLWLMAQPEYMQYYDVFSSVRGAGFWAWKPLIILDALKTDDEVLYLDASVVPTGNKAIEDFMQKVETVLCITTNWPHGEWCKRSLFVNMGCNEEKYWTAKSIWAGVIGVKMAGIPIISEWKRYSMIYDLISDSPSTIDNPPVFHEHRHDQAILTNLYVKYALPFYNKPEFNDV